MIYRWRWYRNARPVTFIVLPRAYVRYVTLRYVTLRTYIRIAFFPPFQKLKKNTRQRGRGREGEKERVRERRRSRRKRNRRPSQSRRETFRSSADLTSLRPDAAVAREIRIYPRREAPPRVYIRGAADNSNASERKAAGTLRKRVARVRKETRTRDNRRQMTMTIFRDARWAWLSRHFNSCIAEIFETIFPPEAKGNEILWSDYLSPSLSFLFAREVEVTRELRDLGR